MPQANTNPFFSGDVEHRVAADAHCTPNRLGTLPRLIPTHDLLPLLLGQLPRHVPSPLTRNVTGSLNSLSSLYSFTTVSDICQQFRRLVEPFSVRPFGSKPG